MASTKPTTAQRALNRHILQVPIRSTIGDDDETGPSNAPFRTDKSGRNAYLASQPTRILGEETSLFDVVLHDTKDIEPISPDDAIRTRPVTAEAITAINAALAQPWSRSDIRNGRSIMLWSVGLDLGQGEELIAIYGQKGWNIKYSYAAPKEIIFMPPAASVKSSHH